MTTDLEGFVLSALDLNDATNFDLESLTFTPAQKIQQWAGNPNASGEALVKESQYTAAYFEGQVRVVPQSTTDDGLAKGGELLDALQSCERIEGGAPLEWTASDSATTWIAYALSADFTELPIEVEGDSAGWFLNAPIYKFKLTCRPFLVKEQTVALTPTESGAEPQQVVYVECGGDVPAEAELVLTDKSSEDRRFLRVGHDVVESASGNPPTLILAESLTTTGFSGEAKTRSGAYGSEKVKRATAIGQPTTMCGTGGLAHVGAFRIIAHTFAASEQARYRISYRNGDGPLIPLEWKEPPAAGAFCDLDMGEVFFEEASHGEQRGEIRVEVKSANGEPIPLDLNYLEFYPTIGLTKARGIGSERATSLLAYDTFLQTAGALTGKTLPLGGTWAGAGDATDFSVVVGEVVPSEGVARRTAVSDADLDTGRYVIAGTGKSTTSKVSVHLNTLEFAAGKKETLRYGVFLRYENAENWLAAYVCDRNAIVGLHLTVAKRVGGGSVTVLGSTPINIPKFDQFDGTIALQAASGGTWQAWAYSGSETAPLLSGQDSALAPGGALAEGKAGILDAYTNSVAKTRDYDNFNATAGEAPGVVCYSGRSCRHTSDGFSREDSGGKFEGQPSQYRGGNLYLDPGINRLVISMRRTDADAEAAPIVVDKNTSEVLVTERWLAPR